MKNKRLKIGMMILFIIISLVLIGIASMGIAKNINYSKKTNKLILPYEINNAISYSVDNLNQDTYVSNSINNIDLTLKYNFSSIDYINMKVKYKLESKLLINYNVDITVNNLVNDKKTVLEKEEDIESSKINIKDTYNVDYKYYYDYVSNYKKENKLPYVDAKIIYTFIVEVDGLYNGNELKDVSESYITIPLQDHVIKIDSNPFNIEKGIYKEDTLPFVKNYVGLILSIILLISGIILLIPLFMAIKLVRSQNEYETTINKYLKIYDNIIVEIKSEISVKDKNVIDVTTFEELLDVENELHQPIAYKEKIKDKEAWFMIIDNNEIWRFVLKNKNM